MLPQIPVRRKKTLQTPRNVRWMQAKKRLARPVPRSCRLTRPQPSTGELAMLLATNQADSIMGSLGLARSDECRAVQAVLRLEDFNGKDTLDENYAALWAALEAELSALSAQGADSAGCSYADGAITVWA